MSPISYIMMSCQRSHLYQFALASHFDRIHAKGIPQIKINVIPYFLFLTIFTTSIYS